VAHEYLITSEEWDIPSMASLLTFFHHLLPKHFARPVRYFVLFSHIAINDNKKIKEDIKENPTEK
jgi:hypothetical protein